MSYLACMAAGAALALMISWYVRHPDDRATEKEAKEARLNTPINEDHDNAEAERKKQERKEWIEEHERQFFNMMNYTGAKQK